MFKNLFLGNTNIDFHNIGSRFYKIFIFEFIIFSAVLIGSIFGFLNLNLSVDFTGGTTYQLDTEYTDNEIDDVLNNKILPVSRYQTFDNSNTIIFRAVESTQERETELLNYLSDKCFSASSAAMHPIPAAVTACLKILSFTSPAANTPGMFVIVESGFVIK